MSSNFDAIPAEFDTARVKAAGSTYSYSRRRWNGFDVWQEHIRRSAASVGNAFSARPDRDLRRAVVAG